VLCVTATNDPVDDSPGEKTGLMTDPRLQDVVTVVLAKNEESTIGAAVRGALRFCERVVVMDGHSGDSTAERARLAGAEVHLDPGTGKGAAIRAVADLCVGSRFTGGSEELSITVGQLVRTIGNISMNIAITVGQLVRTIGNISMNIAINKRWGVELTDTLNGFRAVRREAALEVGLREDIHTIEQEMVMKMLLSGYRVVNVPTHEFSRRYGESHIKIWRQWPHFVACVFTHVVRGSRRDGSAGELNAPPEERDPQ